MRAYIAHNMDNSEEFWAMLEAAEGEAAATRKLVDDWIRLLKKTEERKNATEVKAHRLAKERKVKEVGKKKAEEEVKRLR